MAEASPHAAAAPPLDFGRRSLVLPTPSESAAKCIGYALIAVALAAGFFYLLMCFWSPSNPGTDQNGYQVGGKLFAQTFTTGFKPESPFSFIGWMWVRTPDGWYYPKYPLGLPVLNALVIWIGGKAHAVTWPYLISPVCAALSLLAMFKLTRLIAGSFASLLAMILLACNGVTLNLANNPNSHAPALAFVLWGMYFLVRWWQRGTWWSGLLAGFLLGYAVTIRYTEGLLALPIAFAILSTLHYARPWRREQRWLSLVTFLSVIAILSVYVISLLNPKPVNVLVIPKWAIYSAIVCGIVGTALLIPWRRVRAIGDSRIFYEIGVAVVLIAGAVGLPLIFRKAEWDPKTLVRPPAAFMMVAIGYLLVMAIALSVRWREFSIKSLSPFFGWIIPVAALVAFNWFAMHSITGYDSTNESTGFTWQSFTENWDFMLSQLDNGMFFIFPIAVLGMGLMFRANWRFALLMTLWMLPGVLLYTAYYWNGSGRSIAFLRFFLTLFPPLILGAAWLFDQFITTSTLNPLQGRPERSAGRHLASRAIVGPIAAGIIVALAAGVSFNSNGGGLERDHVLDTNLTDVGQRILRRAPAGSVVFGEQYSLLNYLQFVGDYRCFATEAFNQRFGGRMMREGDPNQPTPLQYARREYMKGIYAKMDDNALIAEQSKLIRETLQSGRQVFLVTPTMQAGTFFGRLPREFSTTVVEKWREPIEMSPKAKRAFDALGPFAMLLGRGSQALTWQIVEIKISTNPPAKPTTRSATSRATTSNSTTKSSTSRPSFFKRLRT